MSCNGCGSRGYIQNEEDIITASGCNKLDSYDWLNNIPTTENESKLVEVRFKNTRKDFFLNKNNLPIKRGDTIAVESQQGHDIGIVSLTGRMAELQAKNKRIPGNYEKLLIVYRLATKSDIEKWQQVQKQEIPILKRTRQIIKDLDLNMKLSDVEFQGDKTKATFYYIADERVDFRKLIKLLADEFKIRVEMRQIGARQEAALVGGIGSCGRELCCSTWKTNFASVPTNAAKYQDLSSNAQKLAGQCGKLKCCLMYELDTYLEAWDEFPKELIVLESEKGLHYPFKTDVLKKQVWYSSSKDSVSDLTLIDVKRVKEIIALNKRGQKPETLTIGDSASSLKKELLSDFKNDTGTEDANRFNNKKTRKKRRKKHPHHQRKNN